MDKPKLDRRVQRTRQLLLDALQALILEKGYEAITVQNIIDRANVGRSTFYAHFQDKEDLLHSGFEKLRASLEEIGRDLVSGSGKEESAMELSMALFRHGEEQRRLFKVLLGKQGGEIILKRAQDFLAALLREHFQMAMSGERELSVPLDIMVHFVVSTFLALLVWWLDNDMPYSAEQMNGYFWRLVQPGIESVFEGEAVL